MNGLNRRFFFLTFVVSLFFISQSVLAKKPAAVIFDIDDTLTWTRYRSLKIFHDIGLAENIWNLKK